MFAGPPSQEKRLGKAMNEVLEGLAEGLIDEILLESEVREEDPEKG